MMNPAPMRTAAVFFLVLTVFAQASALEFKATLKEQHASADAKSVTADFEFTNKTAKTVTVSKCESACTCVAVKIRGGKLLYAPGESGVIRTEFELGNFSGVVDKMVALWLDNDPEESPSVRLTVRTHIPVLVSLEPKSVKWDLNGKAGPKSVKITMSDDKPVQVISISCTSKAFKHELKTIESGKIYELVITPQDLKTPEFGRFAIETDCGIPKYRSQQVFASVSQPVSAAAVAKP